MALERVGAHILLDLFLKTQPRGNDSFRKG